MPTDVEVLTGRHARALDELDRVAGLVRPDDLTRATPCIDWNLRALAEHLVGQSLGLAHTVGGGGPELTQWRPRLNGDDVPAAVRSADDELRAALRAPADPVWMPEVIDSRPLPLATVVGFHLVDCVAHGWDLAAAIGEVVQLDDDVLAATLAIAKAVPDGPARERPGAAFGPVLPPDGGSGLNVVLRLLGRDPAWTADAARGPSAQR